MAAEMEAKTPKGKKLPKKVSKRGKAKSTRRGKGR